ADPRDAFIGKQAAQLCDLPQNAVIGTGSLRRRAQTLALRPDLTTTALRGNIDTRLRKLAESNSLGGIILALAGVHRLSLEKHVTEILDLLQWLPAPAQGALAITARQGDAEVAEVVSVIEDAGTRAAATSERALLTRLGGGCHVPVGAYAHIQAQRISLSGLIADPDGSPVLRDTVEGPIEQAEALGAQLGGILLERGGAAIMSALNAREGDTNEHK
ncbi:MAG: hydroxymethylbilane synthase, partial [Candidatus Hydrogenedentes bacterium]|nr:hydroxymethylbilane synthase [Candidatus Hydrogenedentota bacterium]